MIHQDFSSMSLLIAAKNVKCQSNLSRKLGMPWVMDIYAWMVVMKGIKKRLRDT
ncbi:hypothetical protein I3760_10G094800 [Carya illinoinensis]|nr:hypothetical protein I3760_10G094800 [Carya illinoinensis]